MHEGADGFVARVRLPAGRIDSSALGSLLRIAVTLGDGCADLTSRANLQLRGVQRELISEALIDGGFVPSPAHDHVRNIAADPFSGTACGRTDVAEAVESLDDAIRRSDRCTQLPGKWGFAVTHEVGDPFAAGWDVVVVVGERSGLWVPSIGVFVASDDPVGAAITVAERFVEACANVDGVAWHMSELPLGLQAHVVGRSEHVPTSTNPPPPPRALGTHGSVAHIQPEHGRITNEAWAALDTRGTKSQWAVTPWHSLVVPCDTDSAARCFVDSAKSAGFLVDDDALMAHVVACSGQGACHKSLADVRGEAARLARQTPGRPLRVFGCERRCGKPAYDHVEVVATQTGGYAVTHGRV